jgi:hypothetical protein
MDSHFNYLHSIPDLTNVILRGKFRRNDTKTRGRIVEFLKKNPEQTKRLRFRSFNSYVLIGKPLELQNLWNQCRAFGIDFSVQLKIVNSTINTGLKIEEKTLQNMAKNPPEELKLFTLEMGGLALCIKKCYSLAMIFPSGNILFTTTSKSDKDHVSFRDEIIKAISNGPARLLIPVNSKEIPK